MADKAKADLVTLTHPNGKFTVTVSADRAETLRTRGYTADTKSAAKKT